MSGLYQGIIMHANLAMLSSSGKRSLFVVWFGVFRLLFPPFLVSTPANTPRGHSVFNPHDVARPFGKGSGNVPGKGNVYRDLAKIPS